MSNAITPLQVRDSSLGTANRIEIYQLHGALIKCAVFSRKWAVELLIGKKVFDGNGKSRKEALEMAEDEWRISELTVRKDGTIKGTKALQVSKDDAF